jgi:hypothetical protein
MNQNCTLECKDRIGTGLLSGRMKMARHANALTQKTEIPPLCRGQLGIAFGDTMPQSRLRGTPQPTRKKQRNHNSRSPITGPRWIRRTLQAMACSKAQPRKYQSPHHRSPRTHAQPVTESAEHQTSRRCGSKNPARGRRLRADGNSPSGELNRVGLRPTGESRNSLAQEETERELKIRARGKNSQKEKLRGLRTGESPCLLERGRSTAATPSRLNGAPKSLGDQRRSREGRSPLPARLCGGCSPAHAQPGTLLGQAAGRVGCSAFGP